MIAAAVVPHCNRIDLLRELAASLAAQTRPFDEWIVADNGSTDGSAEFAESAGARVLRLGRNLGFAAAVNRGIEAARADVVAILNNDVTLDGEWLDRMLAGMGDASFATGKILRASDPSIIDGAFDEISRAACPHRCGAGKPDSAYWNKARAIRFAPMTAALFQRRLFEEIGLLDERFESYYEDIDFGLRCAAAGRSGVYLPDCVARHRGSATLGAWNSDTVFFLSRNQVLLAAKYFRAESLWRIVAGQLLWGMLAVRHRAGYEWFRGKLHGLKSARRMDGELAGALQDRLRTIIKASEHNIFEIQRQTGCDRYWRVYFCLLRR
ncbi:MAG TPA: glycosyltransferase family 2 protein [Bryobacteraceae bacterium]|jgi:GT2 family glycosyltransferase|nr:glycosyltransferase family 2 protein [Bryobacteraceae bacterium]